jgi:hypothetical protein
VEECTYFWGVNTSWGINTAESKDLCIRKIIRLHNQQKILKSSTSLDHSHFIKILQVKGSLLNHPNLLKKMIYLFITKREATTGGTSWPPSLEKI